MLPGVVFFIFNVYGQLSSLSMITLYLDLHQHAVGYHQPSDKLLLRSLTD